MEPDPNFLNRAADQLVARGFAARIVVSQGHTVFELTPAGRALHASLCQLYDVPTRRAASLRPEEILFPIQLMLACPASP